MSDAAVGLVLFIDHLAFSTLADFWRPGFGYNRFGNRLFQFSHRPHDVPTILTSDDCVVAAAFGESETIFATSLTCEFDTHAFYLAELPISHNCELTIKS